MKKLTTGLMAVSLLCLLSVGAAAYDKDLKEHMMFPDKIIVGNTIVKKGDYLIKYHAQTSQVSIMKGSKLVATANAAVTVNDKKFDHDAIITRGDKLIGLRLGGQREELTISEPVVTLPEIETIVPMIVPTCEWEAIPLSDDREEIVISDVDGVLPAAEIIDYKLVCHPLN